jgi:MoaA/NifB/PqqE/SkfB family radical SAM enzyme
MYVSLDGATAATYKIYRVNGDFGKVIGNIRKINEFKKKYGSAYPALTWQFIVFGHNEQEIPLAREMARALGMSFRPKLNAHPEYSPVKNKEFVRKEIGYVSREEYEEKTSSMYKFPCYQLWFSPMINWDGKLLGCCLNEWGDLGNVFESGLRACVNGEKYFRMKQALMGRREPDPTCPCLKCAVFPKVRKFVGKGWWPELRFLRQLVEGKIRGMAGQTNV